MSRRIGLCVAVAALIAMASSFVLADARAGDLIGTHLFEGSLRYAIVGPQHRDLADFEWPPNVPARPFPGTPSNPGPGEGPMGLANFSASSAGSSMALGSVASGPVSAGQIRHELAGVLQQLGL